METIVGNTYEFQMSFGKNIIAKVLANVGNKSVDVEHVKGKAPYKGCKNYRLAYAAVVRLV